FFVFFRVFVTDHERYSFGRWSPFLPIDHHRRHDAEELAEDRIDVTRKRRFVERASHQLQPPLAGRRGDRERHGTHAQPRMSTLLDVSRRAAEAPDEKITQASLGAREIV